MNYSIFIGIDNYGRINRLNNAVRDATRLSEILIQKYGFVKENCLFLFDEDATRRNIITSLRELVERVGDEDNLLIFFSGHGNYDHVMDMGYWLPVDAKPNELSTYIENTTIINYIRAIRSKHTLLIADSCFSGSMFAQYRRPYAEVVEEKKSRWALTSGRIEVVSDGIPGENSPFTNCLIEYLYSNQELKIPISQLVNYVSITVGNNSLQTPRGNPLHGVGDEGGEFILSLKIERKEESNVNESEGEIGAILLELEFHKCKTKEDFLRFVEKHKEGDFIDEAQKLIIQIEEREHRIKDLETFIFNQSKNIEDYKKYISFYPNGRYYDLAIEKITEVDTDFINNSKRKLAKGKIGDAIKEILKALTVKKTNHYNDIIMLSSRYETIMQKELVGTIDMETSQMEVTRIVKGILIILNEIENEK